MFLFTHYHLIIWLCWYLNTLPFSFQFFFSQSFFFPLSSLTKRKNSGTPSISMFHVVSSFIMGWTVLRLTVLTWLISCALFGINKNDLFFPKLKQIAQASSRIKHAVILYHFGSIWSFQTPKKRLHFDFCFLFWSNFATKLFGFIPFMFIKLI